MTSQPLLEIEDLHLKYGNGTHALRGVTLNVEAGELVVVLGSNGSGKSSLLRCITRLVTPTHGCVRVNGRDFTALRGRALYEARPDLAMIFQSPHLVRRRSVLANVACGALGRCHHELRTLIGMLPAPELAEARLCLHSVGMEALATRRASELSGGQAQRVSIARALTQRPKLLLADEPVASLDPEAAEEIMVLLRRLASEQGLAIICVLHQPKLAQAFGDRIVGIRDGAVYFDLAAKTVAEDNVASLYERLAA